MIWARYRRDEKMIEDSESATKEAGDKLQKDAAHGFEMLTQVLEHLHRLEYLS